MVRSPLAPAAAVLAAAGLLALVWSAARGPPAASEAWGALPVAPRPPTLRPTPTALHWRLPRFHGRSDAVALDIPAALDVPPTTPSFGAVLAATLPKLAIPVLAFVALVLLLRLLKAPLLRLLGVDTTKGLDSAALARRPTGFPGYGPNSTAQPGTTAGIPVDPEAEANLQRLLQGANPEEARQLRELSERMRQKRSAFGASPPSPGAAATKWVTPDPAAQSGADGLTAEERRERARQKARAQAVAQAEGDLLTGTGLWAARQLQTEAALVPGGAIPRAVAEAQELVAVAGVVTTAFAIDEAEQRGLAVR